MEVSVKLSEKEVLNAIKNAFCTMGYLRAYGLSLWLSNEDYQKAKETITDGDYNAKLGVCREDVWAKHLSNGNKFEFYDQEYDKVVGFSLSEAKERVEASPMAYKLFKAYEDETADGDTDDCILQIAIYGEVIYG